jgi:hypothetical protein
MDQQEGKDSKKVTYGLLGERRIKKDNMEQDFKFSGTRRGRIRTVY